MKPKMMTPRFGPILLLLAAVTIPSAAQTFTILHPFTGKQDGASPYGITIDRAGNLYGAAQLGGLGYGTIFQLKHKTGGWVFAPLYSFQGGSDGAGPWSVTFGPDGTLYGTTISGGGGSCGPGCGTVFNLRPPASACKSALCPWAETVLYRFAGVPDGAQPYLDGALVFDQSKNIYGATSLGGANNFGTVYQLTPSGGGWSESVLYNFTGGSNGQNPEGGLTFDKSSNLYGTTFGPARGGVVYELSPSGSDWEEMTLHTFENSTDGSDSSSGVIFDQAGSLYGATQSGGPNGGGTVFQMTPSGGGWTFDVLYPFTGGFFNGPSGGLIMDGAGNLYGTTFSDGEYRNGNVFKLTPSGSGWAYTSLHDFTGAVDGGVPAAALVLDSSGNLYGTTTVGGLYGKGVVFEITP